MRFCQISFAIAHRYAKSLKGKLLTILTEGLQKVGLAITFYDMIMENGTAIELPDAVEPQKAEGLIPDAFEDALMDALVAYLRDR